MATTLLVHVPPAALIVHSAHCNSAIHPQVLRWPLKSRCNSTENNSTSPATRPVQLERSGLSRSHDRTGRTTQPQRCTLSVLWRGVRYADVIPLCVASPALDYSFADSEGNFRVKRGIVGELAPKVLEADNNFQFNASDGDFRLREVGVWSRLVYSTSVSSKLPVRPESLDASENPSNII